MGVETNGSKRIIYGALVTLLTSIVIFWLGFYPNIATEEYVKEYTKNNAPYTHERGIIFHRLGKTEKNQEKILDKLDVIIERLHKIERTQQ